MKVISGMQTGADLAGVRAAKRCGLTTGGWMPKGWRTEDGPRPEYAELYNAQEMSQTNYLQRTWENVNDSDCTIIFDQAGGRGSRMTATYCQELEKPCLYLNWLEIGSEQVGSKIVEFLREQRPEVVNIAGSTGSAAPQLEEWVFSVLVKAFTVVMGEMVS